MCTLFIFQLWRFWQRFWFFSRKNLILVEKFNQKISMWNIFSIYTKKKWRNIRNPEECQEFRNVKNLINSLMLFIYKIIWQLYAPTYPSFGRKKSVEILKVILLRISTDIWPGSRKAPYSRETGIFRGHFNILEPASRKWRGATTPINPPECWYLRVRTTH